MRKLESHPFYSIKNEISAMLRKSGDCRQIIQSNYGCLIVRFYCAHIIGDNGYSDLASFKIIPATDSIADRMARRNGEDITSNPLGELNRQSMNQRISDEIIDKIRDQSGDKYFNENGDPIDPNYEYYDGPGDDYYESLEGGIKTTPDDMDRYKQLK